MKLFHGHGVALCILGATLVIGCDGKMASYHCRIEKVVAADTGAEQPLPIVNEFTFTATKETDVYLAGDALGAGLNHRGDPAFVVMSKIDGRFDGMDIQRQSGRTMNSGFCVEAK